MIPESIPAGHTIPAATNNTEPGPTSRPVILGNVPAALVNSRQWVLWRWEWKGDKSRWVKVPKQANETNAQVNNPATWCAFDTAAKEYLLGKFDGIGFCLLKDGGSLAIDLDHCFDASGNIKQWAQEVVDLFPTAWVERSPRDGLHIWVKAMRLGNGDRTRKWTDNAGVKQGIEIFDGTSARYCTVTGELFRPGVIGDHQAAVDQLCLRYGLGSYSQKSTGGAAPSADDVETIALRELHHPEEANRLRSAAPFLKPNRDDWVAYCFAIKCAGHTFELFHELCQIWPDYAGEQDCRTVWDGAKPAGQVTLATIFYDAKESGWESPLSPELHKRWAGTTVPYGFKRDGDGVYQFRSSSAKGSEKWARICAPAAVIAETRGVGGEAMGGLIIEVLTSNGVIQVPISRSRLHQKGVGSLAEELADRGFHIEVGKEIDLLKFLGQCKPQRLVYAVKSTGWAIADGQASLVFVLPDRATHPDFVYLPERVSSLRGVLRKAGDLQDWIDRVFGLVRNNKYAIYEILKSLSAPLYRFAQAVPGAEHLVGLSTSGKTTLAQLGASVWGCGADPSSMPGKTYLRKFHMTSNALEAILAQFNDLPAYLDELGALGAVDVYSMIYSATGGKGKETLTSKRDLRDTREWRTVITSTGEVSVQQRTEEPAYGRRKVAKAGQAVRWIDREISAEIFGSAQVVDALKLACSEVFGTLGPAYIEKLVSSFNVTTLTAQVQAMLQDSKKRILAQYPDFSDIQRRAIERFAMSEVAGRLLVFFGLIPGFSDSDVCSAVDCVIADWAPQSKQLSDIERALIALRDYFIANRDTRFKETVQTASQRFIASECGAELDTETEGKVNRELAGIVDTPNKLIYFFGPAIQEATSMSAVDVAKELDKRGYLVKEPGQAGVKRASASRFQKRTPRVDGAQHRGYAVKMIFLADSDQDAD